MSVHSCFRRTAAGFSALALVLTALLTGCRKAEGLRTQLVFGTVCTVNAYKAGTVRLYDELFDCLTKLDSLFSANNPDSEISRINAAAGDHAVQVSEEVRSLIQTSLAYAELTGGAFDPTVGPLVRMWGINTDHARVPDPQELQAALPLVNWRNVTVSGDTVFLTKKGMALDLGAIVKGYAADRLADILALRKVKRAIIDLGGNIYVFGEKKDHSPWNVGIKNPDNPEGKPALLLQLRNASVVTSGVYERFFIQDGVRYHHILNPKTGYPVSNGLTSVSIICESSTAADAFSTSLFTLGKDDGILLLNEIVSGGSAGAAQVSDLQNVPGLDVPLSAVFIMDDKQVYASDALQDVLRIYDTAYGSAEFF